MTPRHSPARQKGQIIIITLFLFGLAFSVSLFGFVSTRNLSLKDDEQTQRALIQARDALIGYATTNATRPGNLPCPDRSGSGSASSCGSVPRRIGLLPWKTLGIPDLRDGTGAPLLYAVSNVHRSNTGILNSDTAGDYTVTGIEPASGVIAIIFAPGPVTANQQRDSTTARCTTTGTNIARNLCPANYLEGGNEDGNTNFVTALTTATFNDRLMLITRDNLYPSVTNYVLRRVREALNIFYASVGRFPYATPYSDTTYSCSIGTTQGRMPRSTTDTTNCPIVSPQLPNWFINNNWHQLIFYAVSPLCTDTATTASCNASGGLTVSGISSAARALVIGPGRALSGQARPCVALAHCLEDAENQNGDAVFRMPVNSASNNDRLLIVSP